MGCGKITDFFSGFCCAGASNGKKEGKKDRKWRIFSLKELQLATNNFNYDNKLGEGGFGSVYWGQLWDAVKRLKAWSNKGEREFSVEVEVLAHVEHKNLLSLRGYCSEGQERLIVYDYITNLSLLSHLHGHQSADSHLDWTRRMNIAVGATHVTTKVRGTLGYLAPEYAMLGKASESCDVYSFGILLLELVSGKKPLVKKLNSTTKRAITTWALPLVRQRKFSELADPRLNGKYVEDELKKVVLVGLSCADSRPEKRPAMLEVVELLKGDGAKLAAVEAFTSATSVGESGTEDSSETATEDMDPKQEIENIKL